MLNYRELAQLLIGSGVTVGIFSLIYTMHIGAEEGIAYVMALLAGLGIGYANGNRKKDS